MPGTLPMLDEETFAALRGGDEKALEGLFRARFPTMLEAAQATLHEPARAARAVERSFELFWKERERCTGADRVDPMLEAILQDEVTRLLARVPANGHRGFASHGKGPGIVHGAPTVDEAWTRVHAELHPASAESGEAARMQKQMRHTAAEHMAAMGRRRSPLARIGGVALVVVAVAAVLFFIQHRTTRNALDVAFASTDVREIATRPGQRGATTLSDKTQVTLGADTHLLIPPGFPTRVRAVKLDGAASFSVAPGQEPMFTVRTPSGDLEVAGTAFDVSAFAGDPYAVLRVREGNVTIRAGKRTATVAAGEAYTVSARGELAAATAEQVDEGLSWVGGELVVVDRPLKDVLPLLRRWYDLTLTPENTDMLARRVSFRAGLDSMRAAMRELQASGSVVIDYDGKRNLMREVSTSR